MSDHSFSGSLALISFLNLSFTSVKFLDEVLIVKTHWKSAVFQRGANFEPLSPALHKGVRFLQLPLPSR
jgi:hypothetical protein